LQFGFIGSIQVFPLVEDFPLPCLRIASLLIDTINLEVKNKVESLPIS